MSKLYGRFKPKNHKGKWLVVTDDDEEIIITEIPKHIRHPDNVAMIIALSLTMSGIGLLNPV